MCRRLRLVAVSFAIVALVVPVVLAGQGLPPYMPINPAAASRTVLGFEPYRAPRPGKWTLSPSVDYASAIEHAQIAHAEYDLDAELFRLRLRLARDVSPRAFVQFDVEGDGSYGGVLDGFLDWYHGLLGINMPERQRRPRNAFLWDFTPPNGAVLDRRPSDFYFGDIRLGAGYRLTSALQLLATVTLPTSTGPEGYGRDVVGSGLITSLRVPLARPLMYEGSVGLGFTPTHGTLAPYQHTTMVSTSSGLTWRFWGRQSLYGNIFYHRAYYHDTTLPPLDDYDLSFDFGWSLLTKGGREWRIGMTEDLKPSGPGIDLVFRLGRS